MTRPSSRSLQLSQSKDVVQSDNPITSLGIRAGVTGFLGKKFKTPIWRLFLKLEMLKPNTRDIGTKRAQVADGDSLRPDKGGSPLDTILDPPPPSSAVVSSLVRGLDTHSDGQFVDHTRSPEQNCIPSVPCMALQNSDHSVDAVVISTLLKLP